MYSNKNNHSLAILTGKKYVLVNLVQEFLEIEAWLLLTFFVSLHSHLSLIYSIVTYYREQMFEKGDSSNRQKMNVWSFQQGLRQNLSWFSS